MKFKVPSIIFFVLAMCVLAKPVFAEEPKMVFAAYLQGAPVYGTTIESYKKEIRDAQALGIDGFVYYILSANIGSDPRIFTAADESGFKMILAITDCCDFIDPVSSPPLVVNLIKTTTKHPSYYKYNNRPVVLTWRGEDREPQFWPEGIIAPLKKEGIDILLMPFFSIQKKDVDIAQWAWPNWFKNYAGGFNFVSAARLPQDTIKYGEQQTDYMKTINKFYMAGVSPYYFRTRHSAATRDYVEYDGGEEIAKQWESIINVQKPKWVNIVTWNDYTESYINPVDTKRTDIFLTNPGFGNNTRPLLKPHNGYAQLMKYYITWYKTGSQPPITSDSLFYFYRTHPKNLVASDEPNDIRTHGTSGTSTNDDGSHNNILDVIYITTILTKPARLTVVSGGSSSTKNIETGIQHSRIPLKPGRQLFQLYRNNNLIFEKEGEEILSQIKLYNFILTTGYVYSNNQTIPGDFNGDGNVDGADFTKIKAEFGHPYTIFDYNLLVGNWGK